MIFLVSCVSEKRPEPAPAKDLFISDLFKKSRAYVESTGKPWFILSAKYGLVDPEECICPYDKTLNKMPKEKRRKWAEGVLGQLLPHLDGVNSVVILAGKHYREFLELELSNRGFNVCVPMHGLQIGKQLSWLDASDSRRLIDTIRFYDILKRLEKRVGGAAQVLANCNGRMNWPKRGVYFFYEYGEVRSGSGLRVVHIGTNAVTTKSKKRKLWDRLADHRGTANDVGGEVNGSIFRRLVGEALAEQKEKLTSWSGKKSNDEQLGRLVSRHICAMPFLWLNVEDSPGPRSLRAIFKRNTIALLSNCRRQPVDPASPNWLGQWSPSKEVRESGLWNQRNVEKDYDPSFLDEMEKWIYRTNPP